jgi:hypothetical protein
MNVAVKTLLCAHYHADVKPVEAGDYMKCSSAPSSKNK